MALSRLFVKSFLTLRHITIALSGTTTSQAILSCTFSTTRNMKHDDENITSGATKKRGRGALKAAIVLALLLLASLAGAYFLHQDSDNAKAGLKDAKNQISQLQKENAMLKIELDTTKVSLRREKELRERYELECDSIKTMFPIYITEMEVNNADGSGKVVGGGDIVAANSMYLMPRIKYMGLKPGTKAELLVRLYDNEDKLVTGSSSPAGYSYSFKIDPVEPGVSTMSLSGWGGADRGHFKAGTYRYEVWMGDMCLKQKSFTLR